jgi:FtsE: cell division ATP-binding protein FtsE
MGYPFP